MPCHSCLASQCSTTPCGAGDRLGAANLHKPIPTFNRLVQYTPSGGEHVGAGAVKKLVKMVQRGSEAACAAGAAHALAVFTTGKNASTYRASVQASGGVPATLM